MKRNVLLKANAVQLSGVLSWSYHWSVPFDQWRPFYALVPPWSGTRPSLTPIKPLSTLQLNLKEIYCQKRLLNFMVIKSRGRIISRSSFFRGPLSIRRHFHVNTPHIPKRYLISGPHEVNYIQALWLIREHCPWWDLCRRSHCLDHPF